MFNEDERIQNLLPALTDFCERNIEDYELILVDDGSSDDTVHKARRLANGKQVKVIMHGRNMGKGAAVKTGIAASNGEKIIFIDADGSINPNELPQMLSKLDKYDMVYGSRISYGSKITKSQTIYRVIAGKIFNHIVNLMFDINIYDTLCGFKGFKSEVAKNIARNMQSNRFEFDVEMFIIAKNAGYNIEELPITWKDVKGSKVNMLRDPLKMFSSIIKLKLRLFFRHMKKS